MKKTQKKSDKKNQERRQAIIEILRSDSPWDAYSKFIGWLFQQPEDTRSQCLTDFLGYRFLFGNNVMDLMAHTPEFAQARIRAIELLVAKMIPKFGDGLNPARADTPLIEKASVVYDYLAELRLHGDDVATYVLITLLNGKDIQGQYIAKYFSPTLADLNIEPKSWEDMGREIAIFARSKPDEFVKLQTLLRNNAFHELCEFVGECIAKAPIEEHRLYAAWIILESFGSAYDMANMANKFLSDVNSLFSSQQIQESMGSNREHIC